MRQVFLGGVLYAALAASPALSQDQSVVNIRQAFVTCVWSATFDSPLIKTEPRLAIEIGFQACKTEEGAIIAYMQGFQITPANISITLAGMKSQIKQDILVKRPQ